MFGRNTEKIIEQQGEPTWKVLKDADIARLKRLLMEAHKCQSCGVEPGKEHRSTCPIYVAGEDSCRVEHGGPSVFKVMKYQQAEITRLKGLLEEIEEVLDATIRQDCFDIIRFPGLKSDLIHRYKMIREILAKEPPCAE